MAPQPVELRSRGPRVAVVAIWLAGVLLAGCGDREMPSPSSSPTAPPVRSGASEIDPQLLQPLTALGPCTAEPNVLDEEPADGALFPDGTVLTSQQTTGPLTSIKGYIPMTPVQVRVFYQDQDSYDVVQVEDEIRESEVLLADGNHRLFVKAQAICEQGSVFLAVVAPEAAAGQVPAPAGGGN